MSKRRKVLTQGLQSNACAFVLHGSVRGMVYHELVAVQNCVVHLF